MAGVRLVIPMLARTGQASAYLAAWAPRFAEVNAEPGCLQYELFQSAADPERLCLLEHWATREAFDAHYRLERTKTDPEHPKQLARAFLDADSVASGVEITFERRVYRFDAEQARWSVVE